ncbi:MBL fold metallo-hydrolase [Roseovarius spongiae]|uniref:MBL fold metallo-hydrolase n=1 Tax=Roseovarius spongiae TaxID=2320272 RepID=A0A3A8B6W5_9RHOB|nr:MBL fold metallo-hydrolase [Roseovarius spongiae]RKF17085.1 MBL fold metallo-hydrolase [Roseovarius spongiae]
MAKEVAGDWYKARALGDGVTHIHEIHVANWLRCNIWHVRGRDRDLVIDTGMGLRPLAGEIAALAERPVTGVMTHSHFDHAGGLHQFAHRCGHPQEAAIIAKPTAANTVADTGFVVADTFTALPHAGFSHEQYVVKPAPLTQLVEEGDVLDLGDRAFRVFHLPGHSPGSIALWEAETGLLFSGDVVYDGDLIDDLYHSDAATLAESHARLRELPVRTVHAGHFASFGRDRLHAILDDYAAGGRRSGDAASWIAGVSGRADND